MPGLISRYSTNSIQGTQQTNSGDKQTVSIWANCLTGTCLLNYKGVCTLVEYL